MEETVSGIQVASVLICGISEFKKVCLHIVDVKVEALGFRVQLVCHLQTRCYLPQANRHEVSFHYFGGFVG